MLEVIPHIHKDKINAWSEGALIQVFNGEWIKVYGGPRWINVYGEPRWSSHKEYRVDPKCAYAFNMVESSAKGDATLELYKHWLDGGEVIAQVCTKPSEEYSVKNKSDDPFEYWMTHVVENLKTFNYYIPKPPKQELWVRVDDEGKILESELQNEGFIKHTHSWHRVPTWGNQE
jgi:hypothetical protein